VLILRRWMVLGRKGPQKGSRKKKEQEKEQYLGKGGVEKKEGEGFKGAIDGAPP